MQLYVGDARQFVRDSIQNQLADKLSHEYVAYFGRKPPPGEVASWKNSLRAMSQVVQYADLLQSGVLLEYQLPRASSRLDCMLTGHDAAGIPRALIVELKQWAECDHADGEYVVTWLVGGYRDVLHPSVQADRYCRYLADSHMAFHADAPVVLEACAYLHNYTFGHDDALQNPKFGPVLSRTPTFSKDEVDMLAGHLQTRLSGGNGGPVLERVRRSSYRPSKKLLDHVGSVVKGNPAYLLLDEQLVAYDKVLTILRKGLHNERKHVVIVNGGPGTGKSAVALNILADLALQGRSVHYATGSKAFTETLRKRVGPRASQLIRYFNSYMDFDEDGIDVLVADESHRLRETSANRFTPKAKRSGLPQVQELLRAARVSVFFVDDLQGIRPKEIGSAAYIRQKAEEFGSQVHEFHLETQFRCAGSEAFLHWVDGTLGIGPTDPFLWKGQEGFDFRIFDAPESLDAAIAAKLQEGHTARLVAGFCWPWSDPNPDGSLVDDVKVGGFRRPWNAKPEATHLAAGIPKASFWADDPRGYAQVGCVYTAQGFEFDYVGIIVGRDLHYDQVRAEWVGMKGESKDPGLPKGPEVARFIKHAYRVLLSRGMKGCYVHFVDEGTRNFVMSRISTEAKRAMHVA